MRKLFLVLLGLLAMGECSDVQAGRRHGRTCPPCRACTPQPACCQPTPSCETFGAGGIHKDADTHLCALYVSGVFNGYSFYYALRCPSQTPQGLSGTFVPQGPCPANYPPEACILLVRISSSGEKLHAVGDPPQLNPKHKHDDPLVLKNSPDVPSAMDPELKTSETANVPRQFVKFDLGGSVPTIYAKLHSLTVEQRVNTVYKHRGNYLIGQEIEPPTNGNYNPVPIPLNHVTVIGKYEAIVRVPGGGSHHVVTSTALR